MKSHSHSVDAPALLLEARASHTPINSIPTALLPADLIAAYRLQEKLVEELLRINHGKTIGYKVACTNKLAQDLLKVEEPFYGRMMTHSSFKAGAQLDPKNFFFRCMEAEFSFKISRDLPARTIVADELGDYIGAILPSIEIVDSRFADWVKIDALSHIADNACHGAWIEGEPFTNWQKIDLAKQKVKLFVNGELTREGSGEAVLGNPLNVVVWLANTLVRLGKQLKAGELISTGITTNVYFAAPGDKISADFGEVGQLGLSFSAIG
jgi:2-keto-4-pentenoate hydratase